MAIITLRIDTRKSRQHRDGSYPVVLALSHETKLARINLGFSLQTHEWDQENLQPIGIPNNKHIGAKIRAQLSTAELLLHSLKLELATLPIAELKAMVEAEIFGLENKSSRLKQRYVERTINRASLTDVAEVKMERLELAKKFGNRSALKTALAAVQDFTGRKNILFVEFDYHTLQNFCAHCSGKGMKPNSIGAYLRQIKALFNEAIRSKDIERDIYPFTDFRIPKSPRTKKRALRKEEIQTIRELEIEPGSALWNARNYFLFMFNNMGINFIDLVKLKKEQLTNAKYDMKGKLLEGRINYERSKTQGSFSIKLTPESISILNEFKVAKKKSQEYIFPFGFENSETGRRRYEQHRKRVNAKIKELAKLAGIDDEVTTYYARHSWATIGKRNNLPITLISEALGHADTKTTEIYLASFDDDAMDAANEMVVG